MILLVVTGNSTLIAGVVLEKSWIALTGGGVTGLFWPAMRFARGLREANIRIRLSELAFTLAKTPEEASVILREAFGFLKHDGQTHVEVKSL